MSGASNTTSQWCAGPTGSGNPQGTSSNIETRCDISRNSPDRGQSNGQNYLVIGALAVAVLSIGINVGMFLSHRLTTKDLAIMQGQTDSQGRKTVGLGIENNIDTKPAQAQLEALRMELNKNSEKINGFSNDLNNLASSMDQKLRKLEEDLTRNKKPQGSNRIHYKEKENTKADEEKSWIATLGNFCGRCLLSLLSVALDVAIFCGFGVLFFISIAAILWFLMWYLLLALISLSK